MDNITVVQNVYSLSDESEFKKGYLILFGNAYYGYHCNDIKVLPKMWSIAIHQSKGKYPGDVSLQKDGKCIRSLNNANMKILNKTCQYPYTLNKY